MEASAFYPGSIGEIIQGDYEGKSVLLSCPINLYTKVKIIERKKSLYKYRYPKSAQFMKNLLSRWKYENYYLNLDIEISSGIPKGKGFASSTADLCALYNSLIRLFNRKYTENELIEECLRLEPTDSILFNQMTLFDYKEGKLKRVLGEYIEFNILVFEGSAVVNTVEFNKKKLPCLASVDDLVALLGNAAAKKEIDKISQISTESIIRNRRRLEYSIIEQVIDFSIQTGGLGIIGAHSGDVLGVIYDNTEALNFAINYDFHITGYKKYPIKALDKINIRFE